MQITFYESHKHTLFCATFMNFNWNCESVALWPQRIGPYNSIGWPFAKTRAIQLRHQCHEWFTLLTIPFALFVCPFWGELLHKNCATSAPICSLAIVGLVVLETGLFVLEIYFMFVCLFVCFLTTRPQKTNQRKQTEKRVQTRKSPGIDSYDLLVYDLYDF